MAETKAQFAAKVRAEAKAMEALFTQADREGEWIALAAIDGPIDSHDLFTSSKLREANRKGSYRHPARKWCLVDPGSTLALVTYKARHANKELELLSSMAVESEAVQKSYDVSIKRDADAKAAIQDIMDDIKANYPQLSNGITITIKLD